MTEEAWKAFEYEIEMYFETRARIPTATDPNIKNALVESALLHTRILVDTLLSKSPQRDDVTLNKALPRPGWPEGLDFVLDDLSATYGNRREEGSHCWTLNKRLAHLTTERGSSWDYEPLFMGLDQSIKRALGKAIPCLGRPGLLRFVERCVSGQPNRAGEPAVAADGGWCKPEPPRLNRSR